MSRAGRRALWRTGRRPPGQLTPRLARREPPPSGPGEQRPNPDTPPTPARETIHDDEQSVDGILGGLGITPQKDLWHN
eukprot:3142074-Pyramimonas_sp.AAC.1